MKLNERLDHFKITLNGYLKEIEQKKQTCEICKGTGIDPEPIKFHDIEFPPTYCVCQQVNGFDIPKIEDKLKRIDRAYGFVDNFIPDVFKKNLYVVRDVENFINGNKNVFWCHSIGKGTGKTTLAYSAAAFNAAVNNNNFRFIDELSIEYDSYRSRHIFELPMNEFIVIDDVGTNTFNQKSIVNMYYLLYNHIYKGTSKVFITSQYSLDTWLNGLRKFDVNQVDRIESRIKSMVIEYEVKR